MTTTPPERDAHREETPVVAPAPSTGVAPVDRVLDGLEGLEDRPLSERVEVLEQAHAALRRALDPSAEGDADAATTDQPGATPTAR